MIVTAEMTTKDAAQILGLTTRRVRYMMDEGKITGRRFGSAWAISSWSVLEYMKHRVVDRWQNYQKAAHLRWKKRRKNVSK